MSSVFVSHNHTDREFARRLAADLKLAGVGVWIDEAEMGPGDSLFDKLESGIREMEYLGVILSPEAVASRWVRVELNAALQMEVRGGRVKVLPILFRRCEMPLFLLDKIHLDFTDPLRYHFAISELIRFVLGTSPPVWLTGKEAARLIKTHGRPRGSLMTLSQQGVLQQYIQQSVTPGVQADWLFSDAKTGRSRVWVADYYDSSDSSLYPFTVKDGEVSEFPSATLHGTPRLLDFNFLDSDVAVPIAISCAQASGYIPARPDTFFVNTKLTYWGSKSEFVWTVSFLDVAFANCTCGVIVNARSGEVLSCEQHPHT
jgi:hypothetical protein